MSLLCSFFFFSSRRRHTRSLRDWSSDVCSSDLLELVLDAFARAPGIQDLADRLPARGRAVRLAGLPGSSGAVLAAWLTRVFPSRLFVVVAPSPGDAERWL